MADEQDPQEQRRQAAIARLNDKRDFYQHLAAYVAVNTFLVIVWAITGAGYFWPIWVIGAWGIGLVMHAWTTFGQKPITEEDIQREMRKQDPGS